MNNVATLVNKHRANGLLIDTNLLVLYLVGRTNKHRIEVFKRTSTYTIQDYELLEVSFDIMLTMRTKRFTLARWSLLTPPLPA